MCLLALGGPAGCVSVGVEHCADGTVCPAGTTCGAPSGCVTVGSCGDAVVSNAEVCDDGNRSSGDGCSEDCLSLEVCGNGVADVAAGEECDDGDLASHDGCSSRCLVETPTWHLLPGPGPSPRIYPATTWDPDRGRGVLYGGTTDLSETAAFDDTWWWSQRSWSSGPAGPKPLIHHTLASDLHGSVVLFGGGDAGEGCLVAGPEGCRTCAVLGDSGWAPCTGPLPSGRTFHQMSAAAGGTIGLYGGTSGPTADLRMWTWFEGRWTAAGTLTGPTTRMGGTMAYDAEAGITLLTAGQITGGPADWMWDGTAWTQLASVFLRIGTATAYDSMRRQVVGFAGQTSTGGGDVHADVQEWDRRTGWQFVGVPTGPRPRFAHTMFYDPIDHAMVVFGGAKLDPAVVINDETWLLRWESATPDDRCDGTDADGDGKIGCDDEDCWARCTPRCPPGTTCAPADPHCGDGTCNPYLEDHALCPTDC